MCVNVFGAKERVVGCLHKPEGLRILVAAEKATTSSTLSQADDPLQTLAAQSPVGHLAQGPN